MELKSWEILNIPKELLSIADVLLFKDLTHLSLTCCQLSSLLTPPLTVVLRRTLLSPLEWAANYGHVPLAELNIERH